MAKIRVSTTVDRSLWEEARRLHVGPTDASILEAALQALLRGHRSAQIDAVYHDAYSRMPLDSPDEWGDLAAWRTQAGAS